MVFFSGMARKPRLEFENAVYHVIARGNYRKDLFAEEIARRHFKAPSLKPAAKVDGCSMPTS